MSTQRLFIPPSAWRFIKSVAAFAGSVLLGQILLLVTTPLLTHYYTPTYFGRFAMYAAFLSNFLVLMTGRYELAIVLPADKQQANKLMGLSVSLVLVMGLLMVVVIWPLRYLLAEMVHDVAMAQWFFWLPFALVLTGLSACYVQWNNRHKHDIENGLGRIVQAIVMVTAQLYCAWQGFLILGLLLGQIIGQVAALLTYSMRDLMQRLPWRREFSIAGIRQVAIAYANFPCLTMPQSFIGALQETISFTLIGILSGSLTLGFFGLTIRVLRVPVSFIGNAISFVAYRDMADLYNKRGNLVSFYRKLSLVLFALALPPAMILWFFGPLLFAGVFGDSWYDAGKMAAALSPYMLFHFMLTSLNTLPMVLSKQKMAFRFSVISSVCFIGSLVLGWYLWHDMIASLYLVSILQSILFILYMALLYWTALNVTHEKGLAV